MRKACAGYGRLGRVPAGFAPATASAAAVERELRAPAVDRSRNDGLPTALPAAARLASPGGAIRALAAARGAAGRCRPRAPQ
jgi:hypothetical protein